mgnify:CR=1 FL=1
MDDAKYIASCASLGRLNDTEMSKSIVAVLVETRRRTLEALACERDVDRMVRLQAQAAQLEAVIHVLQGQGTTMTI